MNNCVLLSFCLVFIVVFGLLFLFRRRCCCLAICYLPLRLATCPLHIALSALRVSSFCPFALLRPLYPSIALFYLMSWLILSYFALSCLPLSCRRQYDVGQFTVFKNTPETRSMWEDCPHLSSELDQELQAKKGEHYK